MYKTLTSIAKMFDVSTNYIKEHFSDDFVEGKHFVYVGNLKRFNVEEMKKLLIKKGDSSNNEMLERFLI